MDKKVTGHSVIIANFFFFFFLIIAKFCKGTLITAVLILTYF